jgi:TonB family protein
MKIMRSIFAATLLLTPALLHAQATLPAQTSAPAVLLARSAAPADVKASAADPKSNAKVRVSTGITAPHLETAISFAALPGAHDRMLAKETTVVVNLTVDETGKPTQLAIAKSAGDAIDQQVLAGLAKSHFTPGTLDGQAYALPVRLEVVIERGTQY